MSEPAERPDPDGLLERIEAAEARASRGRLKVWLGFAPGVGKTYAMLENARELQAEGAGVVVGWVDTHGRYDTAALLLGLEILPRRRVQHRGRALDELDLDAALARRPGVLLLDELAHTNAPGSRHAKRWQDALELLDAGIEVHTTLNVQHVESLNDVVAQITGVRVRETVPDDVLDRADEIVLVDLAPEELLERLREGKVYLGEQKERARRASSGRATCWRCASWRCGAPPSASTPTCARGAPSTASRRPGRSASASSCASVRRRPRRGSCARRAGWRPRSARRGSPRGSSGRERRRSRAPIASASRRTSCSPSRWAPASCGSRVRGRPTRSWPGRARRTSRGS
jgi:hypothetical protein